MAHDACERATARGFDVLIVDTAGRLHTQTHLMRELEKILRMVSRQIPGAPHEVLLVLDATTGQNAITQAEMFQKTVQCTGIVLAKLDGTAKGGAIFAIKQQARTCRSSSSASAKSWTTWSRSTPRRTSRRCSPDEPPSPLPGAGLRQRARVLSGA